MKDCGSIDALNASADFMMKKLKTLPDHMRVLDSRWPLKAAYRWQKRMPLFDALRSEMEVLKTTSSLIINVALLEFNLIAMEAAEAAERARLIKEK